MKTTLKLQRRAFTLLELTVVIVIGIATGGMLMTLFQQQLTFLNILRSQNFLVEDAPMLDNQVSRIIGKADAFKLYTNQVLAVQSLNGGVSIPTLGARAAPAGAAATAVALKFRLPNGGRRDAVLFFGVPPNGGVRGVYFQGDSMVASYLLLSSRPSAVDFSIVNNILEIQLTGPQNELVTYAGARQQ
jgi:hypothetical protein